MPMVATAIPIENQPTIRRALEPRRAIAAPSPAGVRGSSSVDIPAFPPDGIIIAHLLRGWLRPLTQKIHLFSYFSATMRSIHRAFSDSGRKLARNELDASCR